MRRGLGLFFVAWCALSTVIGVYLDTWPILARLQADRVIVDRWWMPAGGQALLAGLAFGVLVAVLIFWGQVAAAEYEQWAVYVLLLVPDVYYTRASFDYIIVALGGSVVGSAVGWLLAVVFSHLGEFFLMGRRRPGWLRRLVLLQWGR